jgi:Calcineurin-like phosphoesterase
MPSVNLKGPRGGPLGSAQRAFKSRRPVGDPIASSKSTPRFIPPPPPTRPNLALALGDVMDVTAIQKAGKLVFHAVGDTGGVYGPDIEEAVASEMEAQYHGAPDVAARPAFLYILGDVIYQNGQSSHYQSQFYEPYQFYPPFIFAIPGNHDGDTHVQTGDAPDSEPTLAGFLANFCAPQATAVTAYRDSMTQPYVFWTLEAPFLTIIGLYSNVDGSLDGRGSSAQQNWLADQLKAAPKDKCLIVTVHHPVYSLDAVHGGSPDIGYALEKAAQAAGRMPDAVLSGHIHSYQRFTRTVQARDIPYVVAGAGGYANRPGLLHRLQTDASGKQLTAPFTTTEPGVVLESSNTADAGFLRLTVDATTLQGEYFAVPFSGTPSATPFDVFTLDWTTHKIVEHANGGTPAHGKGLPKGRKPR